MQPLPLVSVIVPTYNRASLLEETLASIQNQSYKNLEIIVVSDGSTDNTHSLLKNLQSKDPRISPIFNKHSGLPSITRNTGIKHASGQFIAFCDDDDLWIQNKIQLQILLLQNNPSAKFTFAKSSSFTKSASFPIKKSLLTRSIFLTVSKFPKLLPYILLFTNPITHSSVLLHKNILPSNSPFNPSPLLKGIEDANLWLQISSIHPAIISSSHNTLYRIHSNNISSNRSDALNRYSIIIKNYFKSKKFFPLLPELAFIVTKIRAKLLS